MKQVEIYCEACRSQGRSGFGEMFRLTSRGWAATSRQDLMRPALDGSNTPWGLVESASGQRPQGRSRNVPTVISCNTCRSSVQVRDDRLQALMGVIARTAELCHVEEQTVPIPMALLRRLLESDRPADALKRWFTTLGAPPPAKP